MSRTIKDIEAALAAIEANPNWANNTEALKAHRAQNELLLQCTRRRQKEGKY